MDCPACHTANIDGARFCAKCGAPLPTTPPSEADPLIGTIVGGRFRITGILGEGGMGRVYSAEQQMGTNVRKVAVKTLLQQFAKDPQTHARFMRECGTVSELEHPNTIKVYDFGQTNTGELYIAMELLTGVSLEKALESGPISPERTEKILGQVCGSLQEAHEKGIVHRDLKPANIQLQNRAGEEDYVKVLDFGIAKRDEKSAKQDQKLTQAGMILGTPPYMSPEQFKAATLTPVSDIYSLGVIAYEMLTGRLPFEADTPYQWATQHMMAQPFPFETMPMGGNVPPKMKAAIMRALEKDTAKRQQTVREFYEDLSLGGGRLSMVLGVGGGRPTATSQPEAVSGGTQMIPSGGNRPGQTQIGQPLFTDAGAPAQRTMIDQAPVAASTGPQHAVPTTGGHVMPAMAPHAPPKKGGAGPIIAIGAVVGVLALLGGVVLWKRGSSTPETDAPIITIPSGTPTPVASDPAPTTSTSATTVASAPSTQPTNTTPTSPGTGAAKPPEDAKADAECQAAMNLAAGNNVNLAVSHYRNCKGPKQGAARSAIDAAAVRVVQREKCGGKSEANAAASIGAGTAKSMLPANCRR